MKGILVNYEFCTGCHSCEVACKKHLGLPAGEFGIKLTETGPFEYSGAEGNKDRWEWTWLPVLTKACDMCAERTDAGKLPMCVQHCQAWCMYYGEVEELAKRLADKPKQLLIVPQYLPREARGEFVHVDKGDAHQAAHVEVKATGVAAFGAHRHDANVGEIDESDVIEDIL